MPNSWRRFWPKTLTSWQLSLWGVASLMMAIAGLMSRHVTPDNSYVYRYSLALYGINSLLFFLTRNQWPKIATIMVGFLLIIAAVIWLYYGLLSLDPTV